MALLYLLFAAVPLVALAVVVIDAPRRMRTTRRPNLRLITGGLAQTAQPLVSRRRIARG